MEPVDILVVIRRYLALIVLLALVGGASGWLFSLQQAPQYQATTTLLINPVAPNQSVPFLSNAVPGGGAASEWLANAYREFLKSRQFNRLVADRLSLEAAPEDLADRVTARLAPGTNFLTITATWTDSDGAARLANGVAETFIMAHDQKLAEAAVQEDDIKSYLQESLRYYQQAVSTLRADRDRLLQDASVDQTSKESRLAEIERRLAPLEEIYARLLVQETPGNTKAANQPTAVILDPAIAPAAPVLAMRLRLIATTAVAGLLLGLGLAYLLAQLDRRIHSAADLERYLGQTPLSIIPMIGRRRWFRRPRRQPALVVSPPVSHSASFEAFRRLCLHVTFTAGDQPLRRLAVTSARPGEGKTLVAANLAVALARSGKRVLLVDANLHRPSLHALFGLPNETGLRDLLSNPELPSAQVTQASQVHPNLSVITSGPPLLEPADLSGSAAVPVLVEQVGHDADIVIYDLPDTQMVSDAVIVGARSDATLLVVKAGATPYDDVAEALASLTLGRNNVLGCLLNQARTDARRYGVPAIRMDKPLPQTARANDRAALQATPDLSRPTASPPPAASASAGPAVQIVDHQPATHGAGQPSDDGREPTTTTAALAATETAPPVNAAHPNGSHDAVSVNQPAPHTAGENGSAQADGLAAPAPAVPRASAEPCPSGSDSATDERVGLSWFPPLLTVPAGQHGNGAASASTAAAPIVSETLPLAVHPRSNGGAGTPGSNGPASLSTRAVAMPSPRLSQPDSAPGLLMVRAPVRVSFGGGGTDLAAYFARFGGIVVSTTIDRYCYVRVEATPGQPLQIVSRNYGITYQHEPGTPLTRDGQLALPKAVLEHFGQTEGIRLTLASDVAPGTGLGSSSAMTVTLVQAIATWQGRSLTREQIAALACEIEINRLGMPIGCQDQYAAAFGGLNAIAFAADQVTVQPLTIAPAVLQQLEQRLLLFFTGSQRDSASILTEQRQRTEQDDDTVTALHAIKATAYEIKQMLEAGDLTTFGALLDQGWQYKRQLSGRISNPSIDDAYETARSLGAGGGKITGAGGGGYFLLYAEPADHARIIQAMEQRGFVRERIRFEPRGVTLAGPAAASTHAPEPAGTAPSTRPGIGRLAIWRRASNGHGQQYGV